MWSQHHPRTSLHKPSKLETHTHLRTPHPQSLQFQPRLHRRAYTHGHYSLDACLAPAVTRLLRVGQRLIRPRELLDCEARGAAGLVLLMRGITSR